MSWKRFCSGRSLRMSWKRFCSEHRLRTCPASACMLRSTAFLLLRCCSSAALLLHSCREHAATRFCLRQGSIRFMLGS
eukprot:15467317-Alexandrium_andersonii.AAC.1